MCLIVFAWEKHPDYRLILTANRDELHGRPAQPLHWWPDRPAVLAGRDLQAGGTWLAASRNGRFATVTNYREGQRPHAGLRSRGDLVTGFITGEQKPEAYLRSVDGPRYAGFSLLVTDGDELWWGSNRGDEPARLDAGTYGLSNAALDTPWPKLVRSRDRLEAMIEEDRASESDLLRLLADRTPAAAEEIETTDMPFELARAVSAPFIVTPEYGTRCTTVLLWSTSGRMTIVERRFDAAGQPDGLTRFSYDVDADACA